MTTSIVNSVAGVSDDLFTSYPGTLDIHDSHVHTRIINSEMHLHTATQTTLAVATTGDGNEYEITVASAAGFSIGDFIHISDGTQERTHPKITNIVGNVLTLDRKIDLAHPIGSDVIKSVLDISASAGSAATPVEYWVGPEAGEVWHLQRILFSITHTTPGDPGLFGDVGALANGVLMRAKVNGNYYTLTNWKTSGDMIADMYDVTYDSRSTGGGTYGTAGRGSFYKTGAILRLDGSQGDRLTLWVQDNITTLLSFTMKAQGHIEGA